MGGSGGGGQPAPQQDNSAMLAMIAQQNRMQQEFMAQQAEEQRKAAAAAKLAQDQSIFNTQTQAANQAASTGSQQAKQQLGLSEQYQQAKDASARAAYQQAASGAGESAIGGGYDMGSVQKAQLANLGSASGILPQTAANIGGIVSTKNPALTTAGSMSQLANKGVTGANQFQLPSSGGVDITKFQ